MPRTAHESLAHLDFSGPLSSMTGLPNEAYVSTDFARFERDEILAKTWTCIGIGARLPAPRWVQPVDLMGLPLLLVRDGDRIRVFHNVCSHRGMRLVESAGPTHGLIACPYHRWCYGTDGRLRSTPHIGGEGVHHDPCFDPSRHGLREVRSHVFADLIFVNVSGDAPPFEEHMRPVTGHWGEFDLATYRHGGEHSSWRLDLACNWKLAQENHVDGYHLPFVHPDLNRYSPLSVHYPIIIGSSATGVGSSRQEHAAHIGGEPLPHHPGLGDDWGAGRAEYLSVFPNVMMGLQADHLWVAVLVPVAPDRTIEMMDLYYVGEGATDARFAQQRRANRDRMYEIFLEDKGVVEGMQRGRQSPAFEGGAFSPALDGPPHAFNRWVAGEVEAALGRSRAGLSAVG